MRHHARRLWRLRNRDMRDPPGWVLVAVLRVAVSAEEPL